MSAVKYVLLQDMIFLCMKTGLLHRELGMPSYLYNGLEKQPVQTVNFTLSNRTRNSDYFPSSKYLLHLEITDKKELKCSGSCLSWHFSGVSCWTHATMTHFLKSCWINLNSGISKKPCLLFLHSPWTNQVKICLLTLVILDCLEASKSCLCLREVFYLVSAVPQLSLTRLPQSFLEFSRISCQCPSLEYRMSLPSSAFWWPLHSCFHGGLLS